MPKTPTTVRNTAGNVAAPWRGRGGVRIRMVNAVSIVLAAILALSALVGMEHVFESETRLEQVSEAHRVCSNAARDLQEASDYLTSQACTYVVTGNRTYLDHYLEELRVTDRRGIAVNTLHTYLGEDNEALKDLEEALEHSNELAERELYAMRLTSDAMGLEDPPEELLDVTLSEQDQKASAQEKRTIAEEIVLGSDYQQTKEQISGLVSSCSDTLLADLAVDVEEGNVTLRNRLTQMQTVTLLLLMILVGTIFTIIFLVLWPLAAFTDQIKRDEPLVPTGAAELQYLADAYNTIYEENSARTKSLQHAAERDALTGLYNRGAYDALLNEHVVNVALLLIDVDKFKTVNDTYGHGVGDEMLKKVARLIEHSCRNTDYPCRVGGDEFAVIMTDMTPNLSYVVRHKIESIVMALHDTSDGLPDMTLSVGVAFSEQTGPSLSLYEAADKALYLVKERGRNGYAFYGEA